MSAPVTMKLDMARKRPPWRRQGERVTLTCRQGENTGFHFDAEFNFYEGGGLSEVFARPFKTGMDLEGLLDKFCIVLSQYLQFGGRIEDYAHAIQDDTPAERRDIFTALVIGAVEAERQHLRLLLALAGAGHA